MGRQTWSSSCVVPAGLVRPIRAGAGVTRGRLSGPGWRRTSFGFYVPASVDGSIPEQRVLEQSVRLPSGGVVTGWAACRLRGAAYFDGLGTDGRSPLPVPLAIGPAGNVRGDSLVTIMRERLTPDDVGEVAGIPCASVRRALFDEMRRRDDLREAVVAMDMMAAARLVSVRRLREYLAGRAGWRSVGRVAAALELADENSWSPAESRMRLFWQLDAGLPKPMCNQPVWARSGRLLGYADLLDPVAGVVGEYDGAHHRPARQQSRDEDRAGLFRDHGLELFRVTAVDLSDPARVVARMTAARARSRWQAPEVRAWTLTPPPGWDPPPSLDQELEYAEFLRECQERWQG